MKAGNANCDTLTGTHALNAALIGLIQARKTGEGCRVDIGMMDTVMISCGETVVDYGKGTYTQSRFGNHDRFTAPYGIFEARDGWAVIIADSEERWAKMCDALDAGHLKDDPRFADNAARIANRDSLVEELEKVTVTYKRSEIGKTPGQKPGYRHLKYFLLLSIYFRTCKFNRDDNTCCQESWTDEIL